MTHDSNVLLIRTNLIDDMFIDYLGGLQFHYEREKMTLEGRGFYFMRRFEEQNEKDFENFGQKVIMHVGNRNNFSILITESLRLIDDYDRSTFYSDTIDAESQNLSLTYDRSTRVRRTLGDLGATIGKKLGDKTSVDAGISFSSEAYETNRLFDVMRILTKAEAAYDITEKTSLMGSLDWGIDRNDSVEGESTSFAFRAGFKKKSTDKLSFKGGVGYEEYIRAEPPLVDTNETGSLRSETFSFDAAGTWLMTEKLTLEFAGHNAIQSVPHYDNTLDLVSVGSLSVVYSITRRITLSMTGSYRRDDYLNPVLEVDGYVVRLDERKAGLFRLDYIPPRKFMTVYIEGSYELATSTVEPYNYDQLRLAAGLSLRY